MAFEVKVGMNLQDVKAYVEKQDYMSKEQKTKIFNFIKDDTDGIVTHSTEQALLSSLIHGGSGAIFKGFNNINKKNAMNVSKKTTTFHTNFVDKDPCCYKTESVTVRGKGYNNVSFNINYKNDKETGRNLLYKINYSYDDFTLDKDGKITGRSTFTGRTSYEDYDGDGVYDRKEIYVENGSVYYNRDENGNWQMEM